jgi:hypothetical protein
MKVNVLDGTQQIFGDSLHLLGIANQLLNVQFGQWKMNGKINRSIGMLVTYKKKINK